jgi:hypothetical protein
MKHKTEITFWVNHLRLLDFDFIRVYQILSVPARPAAAAKAALAEVACSASARKRVQIG